MFPGPGRCGCGLPVGSHFNSAPSSPSYSTPGLSPQRGSWTAPPWAPDHKDAPAPENSAEAGTEVLAKGRAGGDGDDQAQELQKPGSQAGNAHEKQTRPALCALGIVSPVPSGCCSAGGQSHQTLIIHEELESGL